jgi:hypothetical protein
MALIQSTSTALSQRLDRHVAAVRRVLDRPSIRLGRKIETATCLVLSKTSRPLCRAT